VKLTLDNLSWDSHFLYVSHTISSCGRGLINVRFHLSSLLSKI